MGEIDLTKAVGHASEPIPQAWTKRDVLLFANSIGVKAEELHLLYELDSKFAAFPTYPVLCGFRHRDDKDVVDFIARSSQGRALPGVPKLDYKRIVDGERYLEVLKPLPPTSEGHDFELQSKCVGVYDKGKAGLVIETEQLLVDKKSGEAYTKMVGSSFAVGQGGYNGPKGPKKPSYAPPKDKAPTASTETKLTPEQALLYRLNADYNPLHADPRVGKTMGFPGVILHGLCTWNHAAVHVLRTFGGSNPENFKSFEARFASPVLPGQTLQTIMWETKTDDEGFTEIIFVTKVKETGKIVLANGRARIRKEKSGSSKL
ncbi:putative Peroxisomal dehydratase [Taphrina deformans PYCC 5710]|uniref:Peroxisomal dehydratase n=1 Tax=Taphrina deformans (strain PYCC 5710 / ATCC 11124 / CBS 356.35 / IMI 108563 / JCM 9778 / NBRC 8474) TaxID=1097556 RepID=R4X875_TAPDE|nr:putative Peroxisomal dehydratase [Taphrina deformans PYCC 5710]|eukprot:CCG81708.1 putative Peroxisomal dehydratase [Taphrina deformans PYCC 5710]